MKNISTRLLIFLGFYVKTLLLLSQVQNNSLLNGSYIHPNASEYRGQVVDNKAHGYGEVSWKNGTKTAGLFEANTIVNNVSIKTTFINGELCFGPNSGYLANGPCVQVLPNGNVRNSSYINGKWAGNTHENWQINEQGIQLKKLVTIKSNSSRIAKINKIPKTSLLLVVRSKEFNAQGFQKYWFEVLDVNLNAVVNRIGSFESPISINDCPEFELTDEKSSMYFSIGRGETKRYVIVNPYNPKLSTISEASLILKKNEISKSQLTIETTESSRQGLLYSDEYLEKKLIYPNGLTVSYKNSSEGATITMSTREIEKYRHFLKDKFVWDILLNEKNNKIVLSLGNLDLTSNDNISSLCYVDSLGIREFDKRSGALSQGKLSFSKNFTYLIFSRTNRNGSLIYYGEDLFYAVPGEFMFLNSDENIACVRNHDDISFYDIQKRLPISKFTRKSIRNVYDIEVLNGNCNFVFDDYDTVFSASLKVPSPLISFSSFNLKPVEEILSISSSENDDSKPVIASNTSLNSNPVDALQKMIELYTVYCAITGKEPYIKNCRWCDKKFEWRGENGGANYQKLRPSFNCEVSGSSTGRYCSKPCALDACRGNDQ